MYSILVPETQHFTNREKQDVPELLGICAAVVDQVWNEAERRGDQAAMSRLSGIATGLIQRIYGVDPHAVPLMELADRTGPKLARLNYEALVVGQTH